MVQLHVFKFLFSVVSVTMLYIALVRFRPNKHLVRVLRSQYNFQWCHAFRC